jgi:hypothetical protein
MLTIQRSGRTAGATHSTYAEYAVAEDLRFDEALADGSNLEMDWLWLAVQVNRADQRAYCYLRALEINPYSAAAQRGLAQVLRRDGRAAVIAGTLLGAH